MKESATKNRILDVASRLFYEQGYNSTGINQIIDEADIARGSFYNHFESKHDLLAEYIKRQEDQWFESLHTFIDRYKDPRQKLLAMFDFRLESQYKTNYTGCAFVRISCQIERSDTETFRQLSHQKDKLRAITYQIVGEIKSKGDRFLSNDQLADTIFMILEGATTTGSIKKDAEPVKAAKKIIEKLIE